MNQKDNKVTGIIVVSLTFAVVLFTALYIQHKPVLQTNSSKLTSLNEERVFEHDSVADWTADEIAVTEPKESISFGEAFAEARKTMGPGQIFTWNEKEYSTNTVEEAELEIPVNTHDINLADARDTVR